MLVWPAHEPSLAGAACRRTGGEEMPIRTGGRLRRLVALMIAAGFVAADGALADGPGKGGGSLPPGLAKKGKVCHDPSGDPAGCQPSTFDVPLAQIPSRRLGRNGEMNLFSSDRDALFGAFELEKKLGLFRNMEHLHWVPLVPSVTDPSTGQKSGGDLDADGDGRGLGIAGDCIFVGHNNGVGVRNAVDILKVQPDPGKHAPRWVGNIPAVFVNDRGYDDRELRALLYRTTGGQDLMLLARDPTAGNDGRLIVYQIDPATCLPTFTSQTYLFGGELHEFFLWHDPRNPNRVLIVTAMFSGGGRPDPNNPGELIPDVIVMAITDERTGAVLARPVVLAGFSLEDVGGPPHNETPDANGLFLDGRFPDYSHLRDNFGRPAARQTSQANHSHSLTMSDDGERIYVAFSTAGFFILNSAGVAHNTDAALAAGTAGCNKLSTNVRTGGHVGGVLDVPRLAEVANDCVRMVIHDDPGLKAIVGSGMSSEMIAERYQKLHDRSRYDPYPPVMTFTGFHSAVPVPGRPSLNKGNTRERPAFVVVSDEKPFLDCPATWLYIMSVDEEISPTQAGSFTVPINQLENCLNQPTLEPDGLTPRRQRSQQAHNPTVFENLVFISWYSQGLRVIDISQPHTPREVGYARTAPVGVVRTYPVFKDGLIYWVDNDTGLHVARYFGPRADELPGPGSGVYEGNATSPHR